MADVRINALTTTASSSASDDYVAIDGSANGTRKLSAYSPSFGGNATVGGGASGAYLAVSGSSGGAAGPSVILAGGRQYSLKALTSAESPASGFILRDDSAATTRMTFDISGLCTLAGNLTVSGTGTSSVAGKLIAGSATADFAVSKLQSNGALIVYGGAITNAPDAPGIVIDQQVGGVARIMASGTSTWNVPLCINPYGGNLLLGTTTDSANGKLQLASHTTSAGGIGFGTDTSWYRAAAGSLVLDHIGGSGPTANLAAGGSIKTRWFWNGSDSYFETTTAAGLIFRTNSTTALTLDASQNAAFAKSVSVKNDLSIFGGNASSAGSITANSAAGGLYFYGQGTSTAMRFYTTDGAAASQLVLTLDSSQRTILAGPLRLANAYAAGAPTATGYVTIQDSSGTTYKVLVST